jgi:hypothetical protein
MLIHYDDLLAAITNLEQSLRGNSTWPRERVPAEIRQWVQPSDGNVQYFSLDTSTRGRRLCVIPSIGANYADGPNKLANGVEANLGQWRSGLNSVLNAYLAGRYPRIWRPTARPRLALNMFANPALEIPTEYHYVQSNIVPWITRVPWSKIRGTEAAQRILSNPPAGVSWSDYLHRLHRVLPADAIWVGHGHYDVHSFFRQLVECLNLQWLFASNLTFASAWVASHTAQPQNLPQN